MTKRYLAKRTELTKDEAKWISSEFILEYYILESSCSSEEEMERTIYGLEVVKKQGEIVENATINDFSPCREETELLVEKLSVNKVTPVGLIDVMNDLIGV